MTLRLAIIVCGAGPAAEVEKLVEQIHQRGWSARVILTPAACDFVDAAVLEKKTGEAVRSTHRKPGEPRSAHVDGFVVAPATANTINKLALGVADTYALDVLTEAVGASLPTVILPFVNAALANRVPFRRSVEALREEGVCVLLGTGKFEPHPPGSGSERIANFPWHLTLDAVGRLLRLG